MKLTIADSEPTKLKKDILTEMLEKAVIERKLSRCSPPLRSKICKLATWCSQFEPTYTYLMEHDTVSLEEELNIFTEDQIKSLLTAKPPHELLKANNKSGHRAVSLAEAAGESRAGIIFFRVLFDNLTDKELRDALLEYNDDDVTLLHNACCVMEESLFKQLEGKLGRKTLLDMVVHPVNGLVPPLAFACLFNECTYLFDTAIKENRELIIKLVKGGPDIDETLLQFMFGDIAEYCLAYYIYRLDSETRQQRVSRLLDHLDKDERFDAVRFTGKKNESPLLSTCKINGIARFEDLFKKLTETLVDNQLVELYTAEAEKNNSLLHSLLQKCIESNEFYQIHYIVNSIQCPSLRCKVMSVCISQGHSLFQYLVVCNQNSTHKIDQLMRGMKGSQVDQLIAGNPNIWDDAATDHTLRQQAQTPIADAMNSGQWQLAKYLWRQITDEDLRIKLLVYRSNHQTNLFQNLLETERQWIDNILANYHSKAGRDIVVAHCFQHALETGSKDASHYLRQISDSTFNKKLLHDYHKHFLASLYSNGEMITDDYFSNETPSQCTDSIIYVLEKYLSGKEHPKENLPRLMVAQQTAGDKDAFVKWALNPLPGKESPLLTVLNRFAQVYSMRNKHVSILLENRLTIEIVQKDARLIKLLFQGMMGMMSDELIKGRFLSELVTSDNLHLFGYKDILATILGILGGSGRALLEKINPTTGENLLHLIFHDQVINKTDINPCDIIETVVWLDETYGLTSLLQSRLKSDGSTPLHALLTSKPKKLSRALKRDATPKVQKQFLEHLFKNADPTVLVELLKIRDHEGCTPLHKLSSYRNLEDNVVELLVEKLGHETFTELMAIEDKQGKTAMKVFSEKHSFLYEKYFKLVQNCQSLSTDMPPLTVEVSEEPGLSKAFFEITMTLEDHP